ncbi:hypothetical protein HOY82DRAFT_577268 [Tuber indicum]|nr:hypothetical protein HOY82DRAFT_577268 [Tuber indicum]
MAVGRVKYIKTIWNYWFWGRVRLQRAEPGDQVTGQALGDRTKVMPDRKDTKDKQSGMGGVRVCEREREGGGAKCVQT